MVLNNQRNYQRSFQPFDGEGCRYETIRPIGHGSFGSVNRVYSVSERRHFAVKVLRDEGKSRIHGRNEVAILRRIAPYADSDNLIRLFHEFTARGRIYLVMELLELNLFELVSETGDHQLVLDDVRCVGRQLVDALVRLHSLSIIHMDLKLENVMLTSRSRPLKVKLIDFGSACYANQTRTGCYLQSRYYRAPETLVGCPITPAVDVWSLGCLLAELYVGWPLYPGQSEYEMLVYISELNGRSFPLSMLRSGVKVPMFFRRIVRRRDQLVWQMKSPIEMYKERKLICKESRKWILTSLDQLQLIGPDGDRPDGRLQQVQTSSFVHCLTQMLSVDPAFRTTSHRLRFHKFLSQ